MLKTNFSVDFAGSVEEGHIVGILGSGLYLINFPYTRGNVLGSIERQEASDIYNEFEPGDWVLNPAGEDLVEDYKSDLAGIKIDFQWEGGLFAVI